MMDMFTISIMVMVSQLYNMSKLKLYTGILFIKQFLREQLKKGARALQMHGQFQGQGGWEQRFQNYT